MSASTRTVQQPLGTGQLWAAFAVVTLALILAVVIAFGSFSVGAQVTPAAVGGPPPAVIDHGWSQAGTSKGAPSTVVDHGSSESSMTKAGLLPGSVNAGNNGPRLRSQ